MIRLLLIPYEFVLLNWAAVRGLVCFLRREGVATLWADDTDFGRRAGASARSARS
jgi:hypothetical protein